MAKKYILKLTADERVDLERLVRRGHVAGWKVQRAHAQQPPGLPPAVIDPPPVPMGQPFVLGELEIRVVKVERGKVSLRVRNARTGTIGQAQTNEALISIFVEVKITSKGRKTDYRTLAGPLAHLSDDFGNKYKAINFGTSANPKGRAESATLLPGKAIGDQFLFETPVDAAMQLFLEIPAEKAGKGRVSFRFQIPAVSIVERPGK